MSADSIPIAEYKKALAESVHFSTKTINSNSEKGGIRLAQSQALDLPYISARTLLSDNLTIPTDYQANAGKTATMFKAIKSALLNDDTNEQDEAFKKATQALQSDIKSLFDQPYQAGLEHINVRLRQLLLPKEDGYLAISPISSAGVNHWLNVEVDEIKETHKDDNHLHNLTTAVFGIGGANPQNVGSLVRAMQRPLYLTAPVANDEIRQAFRLFYKGLDYYIPHKIPLDKAVQPALLKWAESLRQGSLKTAQDPKEQAWEIKGVQAPSTDMKSRDAEIIFLDTILGIVLHQGSQAHQTLLQAQDRLPKIEQLLEQDIDPTTGKNIERITLSLTPLLHPTVHLAIQGLIVPSLRDEGWMTVFSQHLARRIVRQDYQVEGQADLVSLPIDDSTVAFLARRIRGLLYQRKELAV